MGIGWAAGFRAPWLVLWRIWRHIKHVLSTATGYDAAYMDTGCTLLASSHTFPPHPSPPLQMLPKHIIDFLSQQALEGGLRSVPHRIAEVAHTHSNVTLLFMVGHGLWSGNMDGPRFCVSAIASAIFWDAFWPPYPCLHLNHKLCPCSSFA